MGRRQECLLLTINMCYDVIRVMKREGNEESKAKVIDGMKKIREKRVINSLKVHERQCLVTQPNQNNLCQLPLPTI